MNRYSDFYPYRHFILSQVIHLAKLKIKELSLVYLTSKLT